MERIILFEDLTVGEDLEKGFFVRLDDDQDSAVYGATIASALEKWFDEKTSMDSVERE